MSAFGLGLVAKIFADRTDLGLPRFELTVCAEQPGPVRTELGLPMEVGHGLERMEEADLVILLPCDTQTPTLSPPVAAAIKVAHRRGAIIAGFCTGSFLLAAAGLLDGRRATTHWSLAGDLAARYPEVTVMPDALYVDEGGIVTGAGSASGIDMCLHLIRREHGAAVANAIARQVVVAPHREGGQAQYIPAPVPAGSDDERLGSLLDWVRTNLDKPLSVDEMAAYSLMSPRTFARHFKRVTGTTPLAWVRAQRLNRAEELLETTDLPVETVAREAGFGSVAVLREQFVNRRGVSPRAYRNIFHSVDRP
ncbi:GlxA family transcriptional regulator [Nonomuraea sp. H19]|uniref:GlxA family transcriptional regulator n=1 Tax=Nonomuraea sp. H19 TaxID=3452206 RepID=UPI003F8A56DC